MSTKVKSETTRKNRGSRKVSEKVTAKDLQTVVGSVSISVPSGSGLSDGVTASAVGSGSVSVGSSSASSARASRMDERAKLENALTFEGFTNKLGVRELSAKLVSFFSVPEWSGTAADTVRSSLSGMLDSGVINDDQFNMMWKAAAKNAGVDLSAPSCSAGRVLAVIRREGLVKEFVTLVGMSFDKVRKHIAEFGVNSYNWRLSVSVVRCDSDINDCIEVTPVGVGSSPSAIVAALLSLRTLVDFNYRVSVDRSNTYSNMWDGLGLSVRSAKRLGMSLDEFVNRVNREWESVTKVDAKQRKTLVKNLNTCVARLNELNNVILSLGGVTVLDSESVTSKVARTIKAALKERSSIYSSIATLDKVLNM